MWFVFFKTLYDFIFWFIIELKEAATKIATLPRLILQNWKRAKMTKKGKL